MQNPTPRPLLLHAAFCILTSAFLLLPCGCDQIGAVLGLGAYVVPKKVDAAYKGMPNQTVVVMVWMDRAMRADHPDLQLDVAAGLQSKLISVQQTDKPDQLKGTIFPVLAQTVVAYQSDHPEIEFEPIEKTAAKFDATRLIYLEIRSFSTHAGAPELFHGTMSGDLKVLEITAPPGHPATAKIAYHEEDISVVDNKQDPRDGVPIGTEATVTQKTVSTFTDAVAQRFYAHLEDRD
jgi:hypothetical protein